MIRSLPVQSDRPVFGLTQRGVIGLMVASAVMLTAIILLVIALFRLGDQGGQLREQASNLEAVSAENRTLIADLAAQVAAARDAYCRLKHYETLSGGAVLRIASGFHVLSPGAQARWRAALEGVARIPAAMTCSGRPVGVMSTPGKPKRREGERLIQLGEALALPGLAPEKPPTARISPPSPKPTPTPVPAPQKPPARPQTPPAAPHPNPPPPAPAPAPSPAPSPSPAPCPSCAPGPHIEVEVEAPGLAKACANTGAAEHNPHCQGVGVER